MTYYSGALWPYDDHCVMPQLIHRSDGRARAAAALRVIFHRKINTRKVNFIFYLASFSLVRLVNVLWAVMCICTVLLHP